MCGDVDVGSLLKICTFKVQRQILRITEIASIEQ